MIYEVVQFVNGGITVEDREKGILPVDFTIYSNEYMFVKANSLEEALNIFYNAGAGVENFDYVCECCTVSERWELFPIENFDINDYRDSKVIIHHKGGYFTTYNPSGE